MKILLMANDTTYTYNLRKEILEAFTANRYEVVIVCKELKHADKLRQMGCRIIDIDSGRHGTNPLSDIALLMKYKKILKQEKPDVVLSYNIKPNVYGGIACKQLGIKYIPNITGLGTAVEYPGLMQKLTIRLYKAGVSGADCVMFQNEENKRFFIEHNMLNKKSRTRLLPGSGVSLDVHKALPYPKEDTVNFLFVARVMTEKGIDLYLAAAKAIKKKYKNTMFHICGYCDDDKYIEILKKAEADGYIKYHGEQKDMIPFFEMASCLVHPSYYPEGMSNVLLEAAAHARPIIATDRSGCRETVDDGSSGYLIPIKDEAALITAVDSFMQLREDERRMMGLAGREKVEKEFDRQIVVDAYMNEIEDLVK